MIAATLFAVLLAILMRSIQEGVYDGQITSMASFHTGLIQLQNPQFEKEKSLDYTLSLSDDISDILESNPNITGYTPRIENFILASSEEITKGIMITGTDPEKEDQMTGLSSKVVEGSYFKNNEDGLLIGKDLASYLKTSPGDTVVLIGSGYHAQTAVGKYPVAGILNLGAPKLNQNMVYLPLKATQTLFSAPDMATSIAINLTKRSKTMDTQAALQDQLNGKDLVVKNWQQLMPELVNSIKADRGGGQIILFVLYIIIGFVVYGTLLMMLSERKREFSTMIAIGMKNKLLAYILLAESIIMTLLGAVLGGLVSIPFTEWLYRSPIKLSGNTAKAYAQVGFEPMITAVTSPSIIGKQAIIVGVMALLLSIYPMIKLMKTDALDGLRN